MLADKARPHKNDSDPEWKWRMLDYYTTFDELMNKSKMISENYRDMRMKGKMKSLLMMMTHLLGITYTMQ